MSTPKLELISIVVFVRELLQNDRREQKYRANAAHDCDKVDVRVVKRVFAVPEV